MKKMKYSEKNYKNNRNNKKFMAGRSDGFGVRMIALLNAMYCSKKFNLPFAFVWPTDFTLYNCGESFMKTAKIDENKVLGVYTGKPEEIFSEDFIKKYLLSEELVKQIEFENRTGSGLYCLFNYKNIKDFHFNDLLYYESENPLGWAMPFCPLFQMFEEDIDAEEFRQVVRECWKEIGLSKEFCEIVERVDEAARKKGKFVAVHVRSGDIVYRYCSEAFSTKALAAELAVEIIVRELPHYNIVLAGDDITSLERIIEFSLQVLKEKNIDYHGHSVTLAKDLIENNNYQDVNLVFYDSYILSKGEKIFTSEYSAFSRFASLISSSNEVFSCYEYFSKEEQFEIIKRYIERLYLHPAQQSFSYLHLMLLARLLKKPMPERIEYANKMVSLSNLIYAKANYAFFLIWCGQFDLFYQFTNSLSLDEIAKLVKASLFLYGYRFPEVVIKRFFIGIVTTEKVRKARFFAKILKSLSKQERIQLNRFGLKLRLKLFYHDLLNKRLHSKG